MKAFLLALGASVALVAPALARDYAAVNAFADSVEYLDPTTVKTDGDIKTFWAYTVYISTNNLGIDWTSEYVSVDCKNDRVVVLDIIGYRMNGDVVARTEDDPNIQSRWIDIPPETEAAAEEDAVCHGHDLGTDSGSSFSEVVPIARRRLIQIAAEHPQPARALQQPPAPQPAPPPAEPAAQGDDGNPGIYGLLPPNLQHGTLRNILGAIGDAFLVGSGREPTYANQPVYSPSGAGTGQSVVSDNGAGTEQPVYSSSECVGPIVAGVCHGAILPNQATHPVCHGEMLDGTCTGPMF